MKEVLSVVAVSAVTAFILGGLLSNAVHADNKRRFQRSAIERGYALYCPTTGEWAWKGECDQ